MLSHILNYQDMRKYLVLFLFGFICLQVLADKIPIEPIPPKDGEKRNDKSEILVPNAEIENGVINVETALASWGVTVTVYSSNGAVVYTSVSAIESKSHNFVIGTLPSGDYTLEVQIGDDLYEGSFAQ